MNGRRSGIGGSVLLALVFAFLAVPEADARGGRGGGHSGGGGGGGHARAPRVSAANRAFKVPSFKAPKMPRAQAPARTNVARGQSRANTAMARANSASTRANTSSTRANTTQTSANTTRNRANLAATTATGTGTGTAGTATGTSGNTRATLANSSNPYNYTYGSGANARSYRAYGYGRGYRNGYTGRRSGYGRSQGSTRGVVSQLRTAHRMLTRIDTDYRGHRVHAMHQISMAIRSLSHRSMVYGNAGFAGGMNNNLMMRQVGLNANVGGLRNQNRNRNLNLNQRMPQAQSDARMSQALRILQGVNMQLSSQVSNTSRHARARGHVQRAAGHLQTALAIR
jgi:hypothetical protein